MKKNIFKELLIDDIKKNKLSTVTSNAHAEAKELINHLKTYPYIENFGHDLDAFNKAFNKLTEKDYRDIESIMNTFTPSYRAGLIYEVKKYHGNRRIQEWSPKRRSPYPLKY